MTGIYIYTHVPINIPHSEWVKLYTKEGVYVKDELLTISYSIRYENLDYIKYKRLAGERWSVREEYISWDFKKYTVVATDTIWKAFGSRDDMRWAFKDMFKAVFGCDPNDIYRFNLNTGFNFDVAYRQAETLLIPEAIAPGLWKFTLPSYALRYNAKEFVGTDYDKDHKSTIREYFESPFSTPHGRTEEEKLKLAIQYLKTA